MKYLISYFNSFNGLSREVWFLAAVTFINRAGTMVIPFLTIYLTGKLHFSYEQTGWIMSVYGFGSVGGAWLGGKLNKVLGFYTLMFWSLILSGIAFISLQFIESFWGFCVGIFILMVLADAYRPAAFVAINAYSRAESRTRSVSLHRMAINLGFSFGPFLGGLIILSTGYRGLFWMDGITCVLAGVLFIFLLNNRASKEQLAEEKSKSNQSPYRDVPYLLLILVVFLVALAFLQFFSTIPLYYKQFHHLSESEIGLLFMLNGFLIFFLEMPIVKHLEKPRFSIFNTLIWSIILFIFSFLILNFFSWVGVLIFGMLLLTFGEILNFPFINSLALKRSERGNMGDYMALFTMAFSVAHIVAHSLGLMLVKQFGFQVTWYVMSGILLLALLLLLYLKNLFGNDPNEKSR